jgi:hypothetical protein
VICRCLFFLELPEILPMTFGADVMNENDFAQTSCIVRKGDEPLTLTWSFHGGNITHDLGIYTTPVGTRGSLLIIQSVGFKHGGNYTCTVKNGAGSRAQTVELKVNGNIQSYILRLYEGKEITREDERSYVISMRAVLRIWDVYLGS